MTRRCGSKGRQILDHACGTARGGFGTVTGLRAFELLGHGGGDLVVGHDGGLPSIQRLCSIRSAIRQPAAVRTSRSWYDAPTTNVPGFQSLMRPADGCIVVTLSAFRNSFGVPSQFPHQNVAVVPAGRGTVPEE